MRLELRAVRTFLKNNPPAEAIRFLYSLHLRQEHLDILIVCDVLGKSAWEASDVLNLTFATATRRHYQALEVVSKTKEFKELFDSLNEYEGIHLSNEDIVRIIRKYDSDYMKFC